MPKWTVLCLALAASAVSAQAPAPDRFYQAIRSNNLVALRALVKSQGTAVTDATGQTPLVVAAAIGSLEAVELLIESGADVKASSDAGLTALHVAAGSIGKVRLLLERGADVHARTKIGRTPLLVAASTSGTVEVVRLLIARGADVNVADTAGVTPLVAAASVDDAAVATLLIEHGANVHARAETGQAATPLQAAAYNGNAELVRALLARKPDVAVMSADRSGTVKNGPVQFGHGTALHMAISSGNADIVQMLLAASAPVDAQDVRGMTPLMWAIATDRPNPRVIRLLLDAGASREITSRVGESALDWARKFEHADVLPLLGLERTRATEPEPRAALVAPSAREAMERSIGLMRRASAKVLTDGGCVACHAQPMTVMASSRATAAGLRIAPAPADAAVASGNLTAQAQSFYLQAREGGGSPDPALYTTLMMALAGEPATPGTDAAVHYLAAKQRADGSWHGTGATRAPMQDGDFSRTALAVRTLSAYAPPAREEEFTSRIARAATWLAVQKPITTEDRVMQLLGLQWAGVSDAVTEARIRDLLAQQRADGGWAQTPHLASDAYATGQAVYTLRELGVPAADPALQRGAAFLLRTQQEDGSWFVRSRAMKIQPYFESGFPYGHDQWISQAATAWAVMALGAAEPAAPLRSSNTR